MKLGSAWYTALLKNGCSKYEIRTGFFHREHIRVVVVGNISACHADAPGSIPGHGECLFFCVFRGNVQF